MPNDENGEEESCSIFAYGNYGHQGETNSASNPFRTFLSHFFATFASFAPLRLCVEIEQLNVGVADQLKD